jgi:riboflavin transporter FmnP
MQPSAPSRARFLQVLLTITAFIGIEAFFFPAFIIRPFARQTSNGLYWAMAIHHRAPIISLVCALASLIIVAMLWRRSTTFAKAGLAALMVVVTTSAVMSRLNYFEWMFHPVESAQFDNESGSKLDNAEMILAVRFGSDARAYPIKEMAYHHILNDVVEGVPVAVTY